MKKAIIGVLCMLGLGVLSCTYAAKPLTCNNLNGVWILEGKSSHWRLLELTLSNASYDSSFSGALHYIHGGLNDEDMFDSATCTTNPNGTVTILDQESSPMGPDNINITEQDLTHLTIKGTSCGGILVFNETLQRPTV